MQFQTLSEMWQMAGHGPYVWTSYSLTLFVIIILVWLPLSQRKQFFKEQKRLQRLQANEASKQSSPKES